jgi:hypothetical protein
VSAPARASCGVCGDVSAPVRHPRLGVVCATCLSAKEGRPRPVPGGDPRSARRRERKLARDDWQEVGNDWTASHPGYPLGRGMPSGTSLRYDEESHREAWKRIVRGDPCAYCGLLPFPCRFHPGDAGTVDHIDPQAGARPAHGLHSWTNYTGSCARCNNSKDATPMLLWIARRGILR